MAGRERSPRAVKLAAAVVASAAVGLGCTADDDPSSPTSPATSTTTATSPGSGTSPSGSESARPPSNTSPSTSPRAPAPAPITIAFAGDIHFEGPLRDRLDEPAAALAPIAPHLSAADLTVVNLETSIGTSGTPEPKRYTFQAPPAALEALAAAGVDIATMANNHGLDFGLDGLADTLRAAEAARTATPPLSVIGIGADVSDAFAPARRSIGAVDVAVFGASVPDDPRADPTQQWAATPERGGIAVALDPDRLISAVRSAAASHDVVVVYLHWGVQDESCPSASQSRLAGQLSAAGADIVVGSHAHRLQGAGMLDGTFVAYGLGNFVWYTQNPDTAATGILTLTVDDTGVTESAWTPARIRADGLPTVVTGSDADAMAGEFAALRDCAGLDQLTPSGKP